MTEAEKAYQYFVIAVPENEEQAKAYFWVRKALQSTLTPQNEWVKRMLELDELYTKLQVVTGFTAERLLEMFADGYTLEKPDYAKSFEDMASLAETTPPNEALMLAGRLTPKMVTCPKGWKGVRDTRFYCPGCKKAVKKGEAYCHKCGQALIFPAERYDKESNRIWLDFYDHRPPEGEEET